MTDIEAIKLKDMLDVSEIATLTGISEKLIRREIASQRMKSKRIGTRIVVNKEWYDEWRLSENQTSVETAKVVGATLKPKTHGATVYPWEIAQKTSTARPRKKP